MNSREEIDLLGIMLRGEKEKLLEWIDNAIANETGPDHLANILTKHMSDLGNVWEKGDVYLPEVIMAASIFELALQKIKKLLPSKVETSNAAMILGTVEGDVHSLGKDIVKLVLQSGGIKTIDLGINVKADVFVTAVNEYKIPIIGLSALMTTTLAKQRDVIDNFVRLGMREKVKIIVGGAPVTQEWADKIGADAYAANAFEALRKIKLLMK
jgi:methanogenic corrinoid protein MtbC1